MKILVKSFIATGVLFIFTNLAIGGDQICAAIGYGGYNYNPETAVCKSRDPMANSIIFKPNDSGALLALLNNKTQEQTDVTRNLKNSVDALRSEMNTTIQNLTNAVIELSRISKQISEAQTAWRDKALKETLAEVQRVPARLAEEQILREALINSLREELANDTRFISAIKDAAN